MKNGRSPHGANSIMLNNNNKISLSPLRSRRNNQSSITSVKSTAISRRKLTEPVCDQHKNKAAQFNLESEGECFYFCQTCAIPLIVQGFPCIKLQGVIEQEEENPRILEINQFLKSADQVSTALLDKKAKLNKISNTCNGVLEAEKEKIAEYYGQIHELINEHMSRVMEELETDFKKSTKSLCEQEAQLDEAAKNLKQMKEDIMTSMNSAIVEASENDYRSVMKQYYGNLDEWKGLRIS